MDKNRPDYIKIVDTIGIAIFVVYLVLLSVDVHHLADIGNLSVATGVASAILGYLLADFMSGLVHFLGDNFGTVRTPIFGPTFIFPFREHHVDPEDITRHGFIETNGHNCLVSLPVMMAMHHTLLSVAVQSTAVSIAFATGFFLILGVFATNQFHKWAHSQHPPAVIAFLQKYRLILSPKHHKVHHTSPFERYYCITTGWLNLLLDKTNFFPATKWLFSRLPFFAKPKEFYGD
jgi:hypothetical protein